MITSEAGNYNCEKQIECFWTHPDVAALSSDQRTRDVTFNQCMTNAPTQKTTQLRCSHDIFPHVWQRFGHLQCTHQVGDALGCKSRNLLFDAARARYVSKDSERYSAYMNMLLAQCFARAAGHAGIAEGAGVHHALATNATQLQHGAQQAQPDSPTYLQLVAVPHASHDPEFDALATNARSSGRSFTNPDSGCPRDVEDDSGIEGFISERRPTPTSLSTGTNEVISALFEGTHCHYLVDESLNVIEEWQCDTTCCALLAPRSSGACGRPGPPRSSGA